MKQMLYLILVTGLGTIGAALNPFWGVFVYYHLALLRPQFIWAWALPVIVPWSLFVALVTLAAAAARVIANFGRPESETEFSSASASPVYLPLFLFAVWVSITYFTARNQEQVLPWLIEYFKIWIMFGAATILVHTRQHVYYLYLMACATLAYIAYEVNYQYLVNHYIGIYFNGFGGYDNNGAGLMFAMAIPLCYFAFESTTQWWRWLFALAPFILFHAMLLTFSRGAMVSLALAIPLVLLRSRYRWRMLCFFIVFAVFGLPLFAGKQVQDRFFTITKSDADASANSRRDSWKAAWRIACDYPISGVGVRNSPLLSHQYGADIEGRAIHNQYLQVTADTGFVGGALYLLVLFSTWRALWRARGQMSQNLEPDIQARSMLAGVETSLLVFCVGATFLSLETFELTYFIILLAAVMPGVLQRESIQAWKEAEWAAAQDEALDDAAFADSEEAATAGIAYRN